MKHAICLLPIVPMRAEPRHASEMTNQLLFGEVCELLEDKDEWCLVRSIYDAYQGYVDKQQLRMLAHEQLAQLSHFTHVNTAAERIACPQGSMLIPHACMLSEAVLDMVGATAMPPSAMPFAPAADAKKFLQQWAQNFVNAPYLWGGKSMMGFDCSGLSQQLMKMVGVRLPRDASQQVSQGKTVSFLEESVLGDLAFFDNEEGHITHVGMLLSPREIVHASGHVRIDTIDHHGIYRQSDKHYTHRLRVIKRML